MNFFMRFWFEWKVNENRGKLEERKICARDLPTVRQVVAESPQELLRRGLEGESPVPRLRQAPGKVSSIALGGLQSFLFSAL